MVDTERLTEQVVGALQWIASRGEMRIGTRNQFIHDTINARTAEALERRGLVEHRWTGLNARDDHIYITDEGRALADRILAEEDALKHEFDPNPDNEKRCLECGRREISDLHR